MIDGSFKSDNYTSLLTSINFALSYLQEAGI